MTSPAIPPITAAHAAPAIAHRTSNGKPRSHTAIAFTNSTLTTRKADVLPVLLELSMST